MKKLFHEYRYAMMSFMPGRVVFLEDGPRPERLEKENAPSQATRAEYDRIAESLSRFISVHEKEQNPNISSLAEKARDLSQKAKIEPGFSEAEARDHLNGEIKPGLAKLEQEAIEARKVAYESLQTDAKTLFLKHKEKIAIACLDARGLPESFATLDPVAKSQIDAAQQETEAFLLSRAENQLAFKGIPFDSNDETILTNAQRALGDVSDSNSDFSQRSAQILRNFEENVLRIKGNNKADIEFTSLQTTRSGIEEILKDNKAALMDFAQSPSNISALEKIVTARNDLFIKAQELRQNHVPGVQKEREALASKIETQVTEMDILITQRITYYREKIEQWGKEGPNTITNEVGQRATLDDKIQYLDSLVSLGDTPGCKDISQDASRLIEKFKASRDEIDQSLATKFPDYGKKLALRESVGADYYDRTKTELTRLSGLRKTPENDKNLEKYVTLEKGQRKYLADLDRALAEMRIQMGVDLGKSASVVLGNAVSIPVPSEGTDDDVELPPLSLDHYRDVLGAYRSFEIGPDYNSLGRARDHLGNLREAKTQLEATSGLSPEDEKGKLALLKEFDEQIEGVEREIANMEEVMSPQLNVAQLKRLKNNAQDTVSFQIDGQPAEYSARPTDIEDNAKLQADLPKIAAMIQGTEGVPALAELHQKALALQAAWIAAQHDVTGRLRQSSPDLATKQDALEKAELALVQAQKARAGATTPQERERAEGWISGATALVEQRTTELKAAMTNLGKELNRGVDVTKDDTEGKDKEAAKLFSETRDVLKKNDVLASSIIATPVSLVTAENAITELENLQVRLEATTGPGEDQAKMRDELLASVRDQIAALSAAAKKAEKTFKNEFAALYSVAIDNTLNAKIKGLNPWLADLSKLMIGKAEIPGLQAQLKDWPALSGLSTFVYNTYAKLQEAYDYALPIFNKDHKFRDAMQRTVAAQKKVADAKAQLALPGLPRETRIQLSDWLKSANRALEDARKEGAIIAQLTDEELHKGQSSSERVAWVEQSPEIEDDSTPDVSGRAKATASLDKNKKKDKKS